METWDAIRARRNVRQYTDQPIPREQLERILEAGRRSPSSSNWQPWHFVVVTDREQLVDLAKGWSGAARTSPGRRPRSRSWRSSLRTSGPGQRIAYDFGQATAFMMITASDLGIGSGHSAVADQEQAQWVLGFPDGYFCAYLVGFGSPADRPLRPVQIPDRRP